MKAVSYLLALCLLLNASCEKTETKYSLNKPIKLLEGETVSIKDNSILITATEIADSRCPKNAVCIWQGYATLKLNLSSGNDTLKNISLCTGGCSVAAVDTMKSIRLNSIDYTLTLKDVGNEKDKDFALIMLSPK